MFEDYELESLGSMGRIGENTRDTHKAAVSGTVLDMVFTV
jgi:hypothetical protein